MCSKKRLPLLPLRLYRIWKYTQVSIWLSVKIVPSQDWTLAQFVALSPSKYYLIWNMSLVWVLASVLSSLMFTRTWSTSRSMPKSVLQRCCNCSRSPHELKQEELSNELPLLLVFSSNTFLFLAAHYSSLPNNEEAVVPDPTQCSCIPRSGVCLMFLDNI